VAQLFNCFNSRSERVSAFRGLFDNRLLWAAVGVWLARRHRALTQERDTVTSAAVVEGRTG